jgi:ribonuclease-3
VGLLSNSRWARGRKSNEVSKVVQAYIKKTFGLRVRNGHWYRQALTHGSLGNELPDDQRSNERLEFLGDSILGAVAADWVFFHFPEEDEGPLTQKKSNLVSRKTLNKLGRRLGLGEHIQSTFGPDDLPDTVIGNALEAVVGALYLDHGYDKAKAAVVKAILSSTQLRAIEEPLDHKSALQHWAQVEGITISYEVIDLAAQDQETPFPRFLAKLMMNGQPCSEGTGTSKKLAEQRAAENAMKQGDWRPLGT